MKTDSIIEGLNRHIESVRDNLNIQTSGHIVVQRTVITKPTFKAYKEYELILWFVKYGTKYKLFTVNQTFKSTEENNDSVLKQLDILFCEKLFDWIQTDSYFKVIRGEV